AKTDYNSDAVPAMVWDDCSSSAHWRNRPNEGPFLAVFNFDGTHESSIFDYKPFTVSPAAVRVPAFLPDVPAIREDLAQYYGRIEAMDNFVGILVGQLKEDGLYEDTVIIHTSDHGGVHPRSKRYCYDDGLHVPLILRVPAQLGLPFPVMGIRVGAAVSTLSIPPTLLELAGLTPPAYMSGPSLLRVTFDADESLAFSMRDRMDERIDMIRTVRDHRYRYIRNYMPHRPWGQHQGYAWRAAGYRAWDELHREGLLSVAQDRFWQSKPTAELYDTATDPDEVHNLAGRDGYQGIEDRLRESLREHLIAVQDSGFLPEDDSLRENVAEFDQARKVSTKDLESIVDFTDLVIERDVSRLAELVGKLSSKNAAIRRWAALGLLMISDEAHQAAPSLHDALIMESSAAVAISMAEALARISGDPVAYQVLLEEISPRRPFPIRLAALNALTYLPSHQVMPLRESIRASSSDGNEYVSRAVQYLLSLLGEDKSTAAGGSMHS
ncbi:MAG: sulfatase-like hydrolase/transferase, partial [Propionibacteriaceae bacterium]